MEIGSCVKCAETFSACGCGSKAAERYEAYEDPITDRQEYKIDELGGKSDGDMTVLRHRITSRNYKAVKAELGEPNLAHFQQTLE